MGLLGWRVVDGDSGLLGGESRDARIGGGYVCSAGGVESAVFVKEAIGLLPGFFEQVSLPFLHSGNNVVGAVVAVPDHVGNGASGMEDFLFDC